MLYSGHNIKTNTISVYLVMTMLMP